MTFKQAHVLATCVVVAGVFSTGVFQGIDSAKADPLGSVTGTVPVQQTLNTLQSTAASLQNTATTVTGTTPTGGLTFSDFGGTSLSTGGISTGYFRTDTFFLDDSSFTAAYRDPNSPSFLPVKAGMAIFTTRAGKYRLEFNYGGRFNGDFEEHQAGFKFKGRF